MKRKLNIVEIILQIAVFICLSFKGFVNIILYGQTIVDASYSAFDSVKALPSFGIIIISLFLLNLIICIVSVVKNEEYRDSKLHTALPIVFTSFFIIFSILAAMNTDPREFDSRYMPSEKLGTPFFALLILLLAIIVLSFIKRATAQEKPTETVIKQEIPQSNADELKKYKDLLDSGVITQDEFDQKKKQLLGL